MEWGKLHQTTEGTSQGAVISPLLATITLDGLGRLLGKGYRIAQYADDLVVMAKSREAIEQAVPKIEAWLKERGLELNQEKTRIVHRTEGFNFLGFHIRMYGKKLLIKPQKEKVAELLRNVKTWLHSHRAAKSEEVIRHLNPILRGWALYYRHVVSKQTFQAVDHQLWKVVWRWAKRRHPQKGKGWIFNRYFQKVPYGSTLYAETQDRQGRKIKLLLEKMSPLPIIRHVKVKGTASPDDPELLSYWEQRRVKLGRTRVAKGSKLYRVAERQEWKCPVCGNALFNGEGVDLHHLIPVNQGGTEEEGNLLWLHEACHYHWHSQRRAA